MNNEMGNVIAKKKKERLEKISTTIASSLVLDMPVFSSGAQEKMCIVAIELAKELIRQLDEEEI
jgi:hypothetical protein